MPCKVKNNGIRNQTITVWHKIFAGLNFQEFCEFDSTRENKNFEIFTYDTIRFVIQFDSRK